MSATKRKPIGAGPAPLISTPPDLRYGADWIASEPAEVQAAFLDSLTEGELLALPFLFDFWALPHQLPPEGDWKTWVILGGRGAGKTRAGAEWVRSMVEGSGPREAGRARRVALVGETIDQVREVMIFGESGILACSPPDRKPVWEAGRKRLVWPNGAVAQAFSAHDPEGLRGPQFDAAWVDEIGCGAINKGTNQPNKFVDPKSSESSVPWFSNGARDDFLQQRYLQVMRSYWEDEENNPVSAEYQGRMIDVSRMYVWAWDTRPFPSFPNNTTDWNDGENYKTGHWITGRSSNRTLESVVSEICERSGMMHFDASQLEGVVRGYVEENVADVRAMLQPLMLCHGFDAVERDGVLNFVMRGRNEIVALERNQLAVAGELDAVVEKTREAQGLETGRVRLGFIEAGSDFATVFEEAILPDEATNAVSFSEFPISMSRSEGRLVAERWIAEAAQAKESIRLALPPSKFGLGAGDVISISSEDGVENTFRIDHVDLGEMQIVDATTIEQTLYQVPMLDDDLPNSSVFVPPTPALTLFLDLPLMTGDEVPHAPHVAVTGKPWTGAVAVHESSVDANYRLNTLVNSRSTIGVTQTAMFAARPGLLDRGDGLQVKLTSGALESIPLEQLLSGGNLAAIGDGSADNWEVFQFQVAELIDTDTFRLSGRLRGQLGSDVRMPDVWPAGSWFVMLDGNPRQLDLPTSSRNVVHHYRVGPAGRSMEDSSYSHYIRAFSGNGLKPYAPVHLHCATNANGEKSFSWIRRTRIMGDGWDGLEVPLGEEIESYLVRVLKDNRVVREDVISSPKWVYSIADQSVDGCTGGFTFQVAQISAHFGAGGFGSLGVE